MNLESHIMEKVEVVRSRGRDTKGERAGPGLSLTLNIDICMNKEGSGDAGGWMYNGRYKGAFARGSDILRGILRWRVRAREAHVPITCQTTLRFFVP